MTLSELPLRNASRQARDYLVYFVTVVMAVGIMGWLAHYTTCFMLERRSRELGLIFRAIFENRVIQTGSFDLFVGTRNPDGDFEDYPAYIREKIPVKDWRQYGIYRGENGQTNMRVLTARRRIVILRPSTPALR